MRKIKPILPFLKFILFILLFGYHDIVLGQEPTVVKDMLYAKRGIFKTKVYKNAMAVSTKKLLNLYKEDIVYSSFKKYRSAQFMMPAGIGLLGGGTYLVYDGIKGTPMQINIDGKVVDYTVRPIEKVLGGLLVFATGVCLIEYANDFKIASVKIYNKKKFNNNKDVKTSVNFGLTPSNNIGVVANF